MRKSLLTTAIAVAAFTGAVASPASAAPPTEDFVFPKNFVKKVERSELVVRFRCPLGDTALIAGETRLSPNDPAYDPNLRVYATMDYYANLTCTGKLQTVTLDLGSFSRNGDDPTEGGYPEAGQLVNVTVHTDILSDGRIATARKEDVRVRQER